MLEQSDSMLDVERDTLLYRVDLPYNLTLHPLGFPARVESNSRQVIASLDESWGGFREEFNAPPVELSVVVSETALQPALAPPVFRCRNHLLAVTADAANFATCDLTSGFGCAWITAPTAADQAYLRDSFTEALLLSMLSTRHLAPVHAACIVRNGAGVLLCGDSGSGKSSLAFACALRGWSLLSDDASFLVRQLGGCTVVGNPFVMRFKPEALQLFPQLSGRSAVPRMNGKQTIHLQTCEFAQIGTVQRAEARYLVFLRRGNYDEARLIRRRESSMQELQLPGYGAASDIAAQEKTRQNLSSLPAFDFYYSGLDEAVDQLDILLGQERGW